MSRSLEFVTSIALVLVVAACGGAPTEEPPATAEPAPAVEAPEATVAYPNHYTVEYEDDRVRVIRIRYAAGEQSGPHSHPDHVTVFLTDLYAEFTHPDGTTEEVSAEAGSHLYVPAGSHDPRNLGSGDLEAVAIELKPVDADDDAGSAAGAGDDDAGDGEPVTGPDPAEVDSDHYQVEFENERVRVVRVTYPAGAESVEHYHPEHVAVFLTDYHFAFSTPDGESREIQGSRGEHSMAPAGFHLPRNLSDEVAELVIVELE